jgi:NAD(P)-dependent dehydrogenase (short-subunit alcohol dehydrogenase family)
MMPAQEGRAAIVTGGSRGIGKAIAKELVGRGFRVAISGRKSADLESAASELGAGVLGIQCDVRDPESCERLVTETVRAFGRLDLLVNNAGIGIYRPVAEMSGEEWRSVIETNLNGVFYCTHAAIPHLREAGESWIINIGSLAGKNAFPGGGAYNASKFGLVGFTEALMQEVRYDGIRVSSIMPGSVATGFSGREPEEGMDWKIHPEDIAQLVLDLLDTPARTLPSRVEVRPSRPPKR